MRILRAADHRRMPWKNGGGETCEIAAAPDGATLDALDWRISMAVVASDGPFSLFEGIDRTLTVLAGELELDFGEGRHVPLGPDSPPFPFAGDDRVEARLIHGEVTDLNVMTRRDRCRHRVTRMVLRQQHTWRTDADVVALFCCEGELEFIPGGAGRLASRDCALLAHPAEFILTARAATCLIAEIYFTAATGT